MTDQTRDARTTRMDVDADDPNLDASHDGDITGYEGSDQVVGRPEGADLGATARTDMARPDEMPKEGVPEASPSLPNDALAEPRR